MPFMSLWFIPYQWCNEFKCGESLITFTIVNNANNQNFPKSSAPNHLEASHPQVSCLWRSASEGSYSSSYSLVYPRLMALDIHFDSASYHKRSLSILSSEREHTFVSWKQTRFTSTVMNAAGNHSSRLFNKIKKKRILIMYSPVAASLFFP